MQYCAGLENEDQDFAIQITENDASIDNALIKLLQSCKEKLKVI